jgi:AraC-like DNA-binding protein
MPDSVEVRIGGLMRHSTAIIDEMMPSPEEDDRFSCAQKLMRHAQPVPQSITDATLEDDATRSRRSGRFCIGTIETEMTDDDHGSPAMDFDAWYALYRAHLPGEYSVKKNGHGPFAGLVRTRRVSGLKAVEVGSNGHCCERALGDIRRDGLDHFSLILSVSWWGSASQDGPAMTRLSVGDCALVNMSRPFSYENQFARFIVLRIPRRLLTSTIGFEPPDAVSWRGDTLAVRLLSQLILAQDSDPIAASAEHHMQLAICDLVGALVGSNDLLTYSSYKEKMFTRIRDIVKSHFTDPQFGPREVAVEAGVSLRYLQKFFTARGTTCSRLIQSLRLEHAARLVRRRNLTRSGQPLTDIAHLSGFQDYSHFSRIFRHRFGHSPGAEADLDQNSTPHKGSRHQGVGA